MLNDVLQWLSGKLYPDGRAFRMPEHGFLYQLHLALNGNGTNTLGTFERLFNDARAFEDALLPDNPNFTIDDAHDWYRRLGIYDSGLVTLADMKMAIRQKMSWPVAPLNMQSAAFIQAQLQAAGFEVWIYENRFLVGGVWVTKTPDDVWGTLSSSSNLGDFDLGESNLGEWFGGEVIVNYLEPDKDAAFAINADLRGTFFVAGSTLETPASVDANRQTELRQLLLKLKTGTAMGFMLVNYV